MKYLFFLFALFTINSLHAQEITLDQMLDVKNMDSDDAIDALEKFGLEVQNVFENQMYFICTSCSDERQAAIKLVFEAEKDGANILKVISIEFALQERETYTNLKNNFKENPNIKNVTKISTTLEPQSEAFTSAVEKSTYRAEVNNKIEFFSFARLIPAYPIYKERNIQLAFKYTVTIQ